MDPRGHSVRLGRGSTEILRKSASRLLPSDGNASTELSETNDSGCASSFRRRNVHTAAVEFLHMPNLAHVE
jgi:hypothetical protein